MALDDGLPDDDDSVTLDSSAYSTGSNFDFNEYQSDSDDSDSNESSPYADDDYYSVSDSSEEEEEDGDAYWRGEELKPHEWALPKNAILPNLQDIFREAARNPNVDINARIQQATQAA